MAGTNRHRRWSQEPTWREPVAGPGQADDSFFARDWAFRGREQLPDRLGFSRSKPQRRQLMETIKRNRHRDVSVEETSGGGPTAQSPYKSPRMPVTGGQTIAGPGAATLPAIRPSRLAVVDARGLDRATGKQPHAFTDPWPAPAHEPRQLPTASVDYVRFRPALVEPANLSGKGSRVPAFGVHPPPGRRPPVNNTGGPSVPDGDASDASSAAFAAVWPQAAPVVAPAPPPAPGGGPPRFSRHELLRRQQRRQERREAEAAVVLQKVTRGRLGRKAYQEVQDLRRAAAERIQRQFRKYACVLFLARRRELKRRRHVAASRIQAFYRGARVRGRFNVYPHRMAWIAKEVAASARFSEQQSTSARSTPSILPAFSEEQELEDDLEAVAMSAAEGILNMGCVSPPMEEDAVDEAGIAEEAACDAASSLLEWVPQHVVSSRYGGAGPEEPHTLAVAQQHVSGMLESACAVYAMDDLGSNAVSVSASYSSRNCSALSWCDSASPEVPLTMPAAQTGISCIIESACTEFAIDQPNSNTISVSGSVNSRNCSTSSRCDGASPEGPLTMAVAQAEITCIVDGACVVHAMDEPGSSAVSVSASVSSRTCSALSHRHGASPEVPPALAVAQTEVSWIIEGACAAQAGSNAFPVSARSGSPSALSDGQTEDMFGDATERFVERCLHAARAIDESDLFTRVDSREDCVTIDCSSDVDEGGVAVSHDLIHTA